MSTTKVRFIVFLAFAVAIIAVFLLLNSRDKIERDDDYRAMLEATYRERAPNLPHDLYGDPLAAFESCIKNKDLENSLYWAEPVARIRRLDANEKYYYRAISYEMAGQYDKSLQNYLLLQQKNGNKQVLFPRTLFYLGRYAESASHYVDGVLNFKKSYANSPVESRTHFQNSMWQYDYIERFIIQSRFEIQSPFSGMDELIVFIKEEEKNNQGHREKFSEALSYLESLSLTVQTGP